MLVPVGYYPNRKTRGVVIDRPNAEPSSGKRKNSLCTVNYRNKPTPELTFPQKKLR